MIPPAARSPPPVPNNVPELVNPCFPLAAALIFKSSSSPIAVPAALVFAKLSLI
jgi:hypothetical protein